MGSSPLAITVTGSWAESARAALYQALFTVHRGYWLIRLGFAAFLAWAGTAALDLMRAAAASQGFMWLAVLFVALPAGWFLFPLVLRRAAPARTVTFHDEGLGVESAAYSLAVTWSAVRALRRTFWDLVVVLDGSCVTVPVAALPPGAADSIAERLRCAREAAPSDVARPPPRVPYRSADALPSGPEDEEASAEEWFAPSPYRGAVVAFPTRWDYLRALLALKLNAITLPALMLVMAAGMVGLQQLGPDCGPRTFLVPAAVVALIAVGSLALDFSPALFAARDRFVSEREAGILYALGPRGLYLRTHSFERRDVWEGVLIVRRTKRRVVLLTASMVHVIPHSAFESDAARESFVSAIEREVTSRPRRIYG